MVALALHGVDYEVSKRVAAAVGLCPAPCFYDGTLHPMFISVCYRDGFADGICFCVFVCKNGTEEQTGEFPGFYGFVNGCLCDSG